MRICVLPNANLKLKGRKNRTTKKPKYIAKKLHKKIWTDQFSKRNKGLLDIASN